MSETARLKMIDSLKPVDYCYLDTITTTENLLGGVEHALKNLLPNAYAVRGDAFDIDARYRLAEKLGSYLHVFDIRQSIWPALSTTAIIEAICRPL